jgi:hypothetical protein
MLSHITIPCLVLTSVSNHISHADSDFTTCQLHLPFYSTLCQIRKLAWMTYRASYLLRKLAWMTYESWLGYQFSACALGVSMKKITQVINANYKHSLCVQDKDDKHMLTKVIYTSGPNFLVSTTPSDCVSLFTVFLFLLLFFNSVFPVRSLSCLVILAFEIRSFHHAVFDSIILC